MQSIILDYIDNIELPADKANQYSNSLNALRTTWVGLESLFQFSSSSSKKVLEGLNPEFKHFLSMNPPALSSINKPLLACAFHWYSVSACQYVRLVGKIANEIDSSRMSPLQYVEHVLPEVKVFRDKIAAHYAFSDESRFDNSAERIFSVMPNLEFHDSNFQMGSWTYLQTNSGKTTDSSSITPWSIEQNHQKLRARYSTRD